MITKSLKWISVAFLFLSLVWRSSEGYGVAVQLVVCVSALLVAWQAYGSAKPVWAVAFFGIALLFNPFQPLGFSRQAFIWVEMLSMAMFLVSLVALRTKPKLSMPSITY